MHLVIALGVIVSVACLIVTTKAPRQSYVYVVGVGAAVIVTGLSIYLVCTGETGKGYVHLPTIGVAAIMGFRVFDNWCDCKESKEKNDGDYGD